MKSDIPYTENLMKLYDYVDTYNTIMETLEQLLDTCIGLYSEIEQLSIYIDILENNDTEHTITDMSPLDIETEYIAVSEELENKTIRLKTLLGNAAEIASNFESLNQ